MSCTLKMVSVAFSHVMLYSTVPHRSTVSHCVWCVFIHRSYSEAPLYFQRSPPGGVIAACLLLILLLKAVLSVAPLATQPINSLKSDLLVRVHYLELKQ